jgi:hypothetical protein
MTLDLAVNVGNILALIGAILYIGRKSQVLEQILAREKRAEERADSHSGSIRDHEKQLALQWQILERLKSVPEQLAVLTNLVGHINRAD